MSASGNTTAERTGLRTDYLPALRKSLTKPLMEQEKDGIMSVIYDMQVRPSCTSCHLHVTGPTLSSNTRHAHAGKTMSQVAHAIM